MSPQATVAKAPAEAAPQRQTEKPVAVTTAPKRGFRMVQAVHGGATGCATGMVIFADETLRTR